MTTMPPSDEELPIRVTLETGDEIVWPDTHDLRRLVNRIGGTSDHFMVLTPVPFRPRTFMQTYRDPGTHFDLEHREEYRQFQTRVSDPETLVRTMVAWSLGRADWKSGHEWELAMRHTPAEVPELDYTTDTFARAQAQELIDIGFLDFHSIAQVVSDAAEPDNPITPDQAEALLEPLWLERVTEQQSWPETTDADRLAEVFERLDVTGVTARMNFACCQRCGIQEIRAEAAEGDRGFVFYHQQDADRLVDGSVHLAFGAYSRVDEEGIAVGREIVTAVESAGFTAEWDGTIAARILVTGIDWRNRLE